MKEIFETLYPPPAYPNMARSLEERLSAKSALRAKSAFGGGGKKKEVKDGD